MPNIQLPLIAFIQQIFILRNQHQYKYLVQIVLIFLRSTFCSVPLCLPHPAPELRTCWEDALTTEPHALWLNSRPHLTSLSHLCSFLQTTGDSPLTLPCLLRPQDYTEAGILLHYQEGSLMSEVHANTSPMMLTLTIS